MDNTDRNGSGALPPDVCGLQGLPAHLQEFVPYMDGSTLDDASKRQFIEALWSIMLSLTSMGVRLDGCGAAFEKTCGKLEPTQINLPDAMSSAVDSISQPHTEPAQASRKEE